MGSEQQISSLENLRGKISYKLSHIVKAFCFASQNFVNSQAAFLCALLDSREATYCITLSLAGACNEIRQKEMADCIHYTHFARKQVEEIRINDAIAGN
jgi:hypothetical protein